MSAFGSGYPNGQFWYGNTTNFPGFLYKKNVGVGGRRSTKMNPGGGITCNSSTYLYNKMEARSRGGRSIYYGKCPGEKWMVYIM